MPFLFDSWYCAGWSVDLKAAPQAITILGQELVLFRDQAGKACAASNRCPHRFAPLSQGVVIQGLLQCPYHGLMFDGAGRCVYNPHGAHIIPPRANLTAYPVLEKNRALWVWMGVPERADASQIIPLNFLDDDRYAVAIGCVKIAADYKLVNDNLLDLTHAAFMHASTVGFTFEQVMGAKDYIWDCETEGRTIKSNYTIKGVPANPQFLGLFKEPLGDYYAHLTWCPASVMMLDLSMTSQGSEQPRIDDPASDAVLIPGAHLITPETETSSHYFFAQTRNRDIHNADLTAEMLRLGEYAFSMEDGAMIAACQRMMGDKGLFDLHPAILETDKAGLQARRILDRLIRIQDRDMARADAPKPEQELVAAG